MDPAQPASPANESRMTALAVVLVSAYIGAQMLADVASLKIGLIGGLAVDMGTFIYPITFTLRDLTHKALGRRAARALIFSAAGVNVVMALYLMFCARVPSDPSWGLGAEFSSILAPVWRIVAASIVAEVISQLVNTEVYSWFRRRVTRRRLWARSLISNGVAIPIDNLIFAMGAFAFTLPWTVVAQIFLFNLIVKAVVTVASVPMIYLVRIDRD
ncbi:MAG: queuosine precursor transporter [Kiritimatiellia bacterium]|nr:queuosine precursor transporter [Kiritimatiellia bacterium]